MNYILYLLSYTVQTHIHFIFIHMSKHHSTKTGVESFSKKHIYVLVTLAVFVGILIGAFGFSQSSKTLRVSNSECVTTLAYIKPTINCDITEKKSILLDELQKKLDILINGYIKTGQATRVGVFVRDLHSTRFAGVNENENFIMASLLKLPLAIAGYKLAEVEPKILEQTFTYDGNPNLYVEQNIEVSDKIKIGQKYTLRELIRRSIVYSDNTTAQMLTNFYAPGYFDLILNALGVKLRLDNENGEDLVSPRNYANLFRSLYNASYLTADYSNELLEVLTNTTYRNGAVKNIPTDVKVAHKFAERAVIDNHGQPAFRQFHECGLVYAKKATEPYTFCIMTEGTDFNQLEKIQLEIGQEIYLLMSQ